MITTDVFSSRLEMHAFGRVTVDECRELEHLSDYRIQFGRPLDLLLDLRQMESCSIDALVEQIRYGRAHAHDLSRVAIVSDSTMVAWIALLSQAFIDAEIRVFDDDASAREWLGLEAESAQQSESAPQPESTH